MNQLCRRVHSIALICFVLLVSGSASAQVCGDCNTNLLVDDHDLDTLQAVASGSFTLLEPERSACDLDQNELLDDTDVLYLTEHLAGARPNLVCSQYCGDCNLDGAVDDTDLNGFFGPPSNPLQVTRGSCNTNADGLLEAEDLLSAWQFTAGTRTTLSCAYEMVCGDCNGDGEVDSTDVQLAADSGSELIEILGRPFGSCDVNVDALMIDQFLNGVRPTLSCALRSVHDSDQAGLVDAADNCPATPNPDQLDADGDGRGAACDCDDATPSGTADADWDQDGIVDCFDNCLRRFNPDRG